MKSFIKVTTNQGSTAMAVLPAAGDGVADDTSVLAAAIKILATNGGGVLELGPCTYLIKTAGNGFTLPGNCRIMGVAGMTTILLDNSAPNATTPPYGGLFVVQGVDNVVFQDITIKRNSAILSNLITIDSCDDVKFLNVSFNGQMYIYGGNALCHGVRYGNTGGATTKVSNVTFDSCEFQGMSFSIYMMNDSTASVSGFVVDGCYFHNNYADDVNFNAPNGTFKNGQVVSSKFVDGLSTSQVGGFAVDLANAQECVISNNTIKNYNFNAIHLEDRTAYVSITSNIIVNCATMDQSCIQVVAGVKFVSITGNSFNIANASNPNELETRQSKAVIYVGPGGGSVSPDRIVISGNHFDLGSLWVGISAFSVPRLTVNANHFEGAGTVSEGAYSGGTNDAVAITNGGPASITGNFCFGMNSFIAGTTTAFKAVSGSLTGNTVEQCNYGMNLKPAGSCLVTGNYFINCVYSLVSGSNGVTTASQAVIGWNYAVGCVNPMEATYGNFWGGTAENTRLVAFNCDDSLGVAGFPIQGFLGSSEKLAILADTDAQNDGIFYSTTQNKPCYKDGTGTSNPLC